MIFLIFLLGLALRLFGLSDNMIFHGELGDNYLVMKDIWLSREIPLLGPATSHPWLSFGPLFYWIFTPFLVLGKFDPVFMAVLMRIIGAVVILENYFFVKKLFNKKAALISSFVIAVAPQFIQMSQEGRFFSLVVVLLYPFLYFLFKNKLFLAFFFFGLMLNFHYAPLVLLPPAIIYLYYKRKDLSRKKVITGILGLVIPSLPLLIYSLSNRFEMLGKFIIWFPYRIARTLGWF